MIWRLPLSASGEIILLQVEDDDFAPFLGRSYDGNEWESSPSAPSDMFSCCSLWCAVKLPSLVTSGKLYTRSGTPQILCVKLGALYLTLHV